MTDTNANQDGTVSDDIRADVTFLRELKGQTSEEDSKRLDRIIETLGVVSDVMFTPSLRDEHRADELLTRFVRTLFDRSTVGDIETNEYVAVALWLLGRQTKTAGGKSLISGALGALGAASIASAFGETPEANPKSEQGEARGNQTPVR